MIKIPVKIVESKDIHENKKIGVMVGFSYYEITKFNPQQKIDEFKELYLDTIGKAKKLYEKAIEKRGKGSVCYWQLSRLLRLFNEQIKNEFIITNYRQALQRDFGLTKGYIGVIFDFGRFFDRNEVLPNIPMSIYFELIIKKKKLDRIARFEDEKNKLLELAKTDNIPNRKYYRQKLTDMVKRDK